MYDSDKDLFLFKNYFNKNIILHILHMDNLEFTLEPITNTFSDINLIQYEKDGYMYFIKYDGIVTQKFQDQDIEINLDFGIPKYDISLNWIAIYGDMLYYVALVHSHCRETTYRLILKTINIADNIMKIMPDDDKITSMLTEWVHFCFTPKGIITYNDYNQYNEDYNEDYKIRFIIYSDDLRDRGIVLEPYDKPIYPEIENSFKYPKYAIANDPDNNIYCVLTGDSSYSKHIIKDGHITTTTEDDFYWIIKITSSKLKFCD